MASSFRLDSDDYENQLLPHGRNRFRLSWRLFTFMWWGAFLLFLGYQFVVNDPKAADVERDLEREFVLIAEFQGARAIGPYKATHKPTSAHVHAYYVVAVDYQELRRHYDAELAAHGWRFCGDEKVLNWNTDQGGMLASYYKSDRDAYLQYAGERASFGWTYSFGMSWGLSGCPR